MIRRIGLTIATAVLGFCAVPTWADTLESVQKAIIEKSAACKSYQGKTKTTQSMQTPDMKYDSQGDMTFEYMKKGDKWLCRAEGQTKATTVVQGNEQKNDSTMLMICDGEFMYTLSDSNGQKTAMKTRLPEQFAILADKAYFDTLSKSYDLKLLADETVDGKSTWVIEATPKEAPPAGTAATLLNYFEKEHGQSIKTLGKDSTGKVVLTSISTDVKIDPDLSAERFVFKAPAGVEVVDMTQQQTPPAANEPAKTQEEPKKAEEPKNAEEPQQKPAKEKKLPRPKLPG